ncbi:MAG: glycosyltransferase family 1 protein [Candidatus Paceibacterota bacterium]
MKRIGIDCRLAGTQHAGLGRYIENLVQHCVKETDIEWVLFFHDQRQAQAVLPGKIANVKRVYAPIKHYSIKEQLLLPWIFLKERLNLLHIPHFNIPWIYPGKILVTIHDLLWHEQRGSNVTTLPAWQYWFKYLGYRLTTWWAVKRAKTIFVPSQTVKQTLSHYFPKAENKTLVTPEGVGEAYLQKISSQPDPNPEKILVYTGSLYPHKNVRLIIQALPLLPDFTLAIVSARSVFQDKLKADVKQYQLENRVEFLGFLPDEKLIKLYQRSFALVFPSLSEGFGLPGIEAMAVGLPVIASDIPIFHEVYGESAAFFDPKSVAELVETIKTIGPSRKTLQEAGKKRVRQFSWDEMVKQTVKQYRAWF